MSEVKLIDSKEMNDLLKGSRCPNYAMVCTIGQQNILIS